MPIEKFTTNQDKLNKLSAWCKHEYEHALASHASREARLKEWQRLHDAQPLKRYRVWPWAGASNMEMPLIRTHTATVHARVESAYFESSALMVINANDSTYREACKALQAWNNQVVLPNADYKNVKKHSLLSMTKFGSGFNQLQWKRQMSLVKLAGGGTKTVTHHDGPMFYYIHPNNVLYPPNTKQIQTARWIGFRSFKPWNELITEFYEGHYSRQVMEDLRTQGRKLNDPFDTWRNTLDSPAGYKEPMLWEIVTIYCFYVDNEMGLPHNLWVTFHWPSGIIMEAIYNPLNHFGRPLFKADYMIEDGAFCGIGIAGLLEMLQKELSETHNYRMDNMFLANTTLVVGKKNAYDKFDIAPMAVVSTMDDPNKVITFQRPGEIYPSIVGAEEMSNAYAERLSGVGDSNIPRLGSFQGAAGVRTPATTTLALIGEGNKRFAIAIGNAKDSDNEALKQLLQLEQQFWPRLRDDCYAWNKNQAKLIDELFGNLNPIAFTRNIIAEVGASTAAINKEQERQNILLITNEIMIPVFNYLIQLNSMATQLPPESKPLIDKAFNSTIAWTQMALETFDVRDPSQYLPTRTDVGTASTTAEASQRSENFGSAFISQANRNLDAGSFTNAGAGAAFIGTGQNGRGNGNGQ
jgi:hypothetical protein